MLQSQLALGKTVSDSTSCDSNLRPPSQEAKVEVDRQPFIDMKTAYFRYPRLDGICNNRVNPKLGSSHRSYKRVAPARYNDGIGKHSGDGIG